VVFAGSLILTFLLGMLIVSIMERRWEASRPYLVVKPVGEWEYRSQVWGQNYPRQYETFKHTAIKGTKTAFGGSYLRDYLEEDPRQVVLFAGYGFSRDYKQARGHMYAVKDIKETERTTRPDGSDTGMPATCWTCKSPQVPVFMKRRGIAGFYNGTFKELRPKIHEPIGCLDCHDPKTMNLRISRPALREAFLRRGKDIDQATHQEMRSLVCAQCHVEYYFANDPGTKTSGQTFGAKGNYLVFPWDEGLSVEAFERYYAKRPEFYDWKHPISGTRMIKMQHADWEMYRTGIHAYRNVSCADCHMPYRTEGGVKFTNHHIQSPLLAISSSCGVCHRWGEEQVRERVEAMQTKHYRLKLEAEDALVYAHFDVAACREAGASATELAPLRDKLWRAQLRWDYISANNGMGFHSPQESVRVLGTAINLAQQVRIAATRLLAAKGHVDPPHYPDIRTRAKAVAVITAFEAAAQGKRPQPPSLLRAPAPQAPLPNERGH
jgi:nitrite reductase (cytochrome c-552)